MCFWSMCVCVPPSPITYFHRYLSSPHSFKPNNKHKHRILCVIETRIRWRQMSSILRIHKHKPSSPFGMQFSLQAANLPNATRFCICIYQLPIPAHNIARVFRCTAIHSIYPHIQIHPIFHVYYKFNTGRLQPTNQHQPYSCADQYNNHPLYATLVRLIFAHHFPILLCAYKYNMSLENAFYAQHSSQIIVLEFRWSHHHCYFSGCCFLTIIFQKKRFSQIFTISLTHTHKS